MPDDALDIRPLAPDDAPALLEWRNDPSAFRWFRNPRSLTVVEHGHWMTARLAEEPPTVWVATSDGTPLGCVRLDPGAEAPEVSIVVDAHVRGRGVGRALLDFCVAEAGRRGYTTLRAEVNGSNVASLKLFTRQGFIVSGQDGEFSLLTLN